MTSSLDTSVVLRLLLEDIPEKTQAAMDLLSRPGAKFRVEAVVFTEAAHVMTRNYQLSRSRAAEVLAGFAAFGAFVTLLTDLHRSTEQTCPNPNFRPKSSHIASGTSSPRTR